MIFYEETRILRWLTALKIIGNECEGAIQTENRCRKKNQARNAIENGFTIQLMNLPITFIPYDAARGIEITPDDLERLNASNNAILWIADRARAWLGYWQEDIGRQGFYSFDLLTAAYVIAPSQFGCAVVQAWVGKDPTLFIPFWWPTALLVSQDDTQLENTESQNSALYCAKVSTNLKVLVIDRLAST